MLVTATSKNRETLLHFAAKNGEIRFMKNLVLPEVNLNAQDRGGATALHGAVQSGNEEAVQGLCEAGAIVTLEDGWGRIAGDMLKPYELLSKRGIYKAVRAARKRQEQNGRANCRAACDHNTGDFIHQSHVPGIATVQTWFRCQKRPERAEIFQMDLP